MRTTQKQIDSMLSFIRKTLQLSDYQHIDCENYLTYETWNPGGGATCFEFMLRFRGGPEVTYAAFGKNAAYDTLRTIDRTLSALNNRIDFTKGEKQCG